FFFCTHPFTTSFYTLSLHDALPISDFCSGLTIWISDIFVNQRLKIFQELVGDVLGRILFGLFITRGGHARQQCFVCNVVVDLVRSEEHTSELQSRGHLVCRLLLEKK